MKARPEIIDSLLKEKGYKFLGWQNSWNHVYLDEDKNRCDETGKPSKYFDYATKDYPDYGNCRDAGHHIDEVNHDMYGREHTCSCDICRIYWKYDSSD